MWFGSYKRSGELKKIPVWCFLHNGNLEFLTPGESYKVKRILRNPRVVCTLGSENGPEVEGTAEVVRNPAEVRRGYAAYRKTHPWLMLLLGRMIRKRMESGRQLMIRIKPDEPNPFAGITEPFS